MKKRPKKKRPSKQDKDLMAGVEKKPPPKKPKKKKKPATPKGKELAELEKNTQSTPDREDQLARLEGFFVSVDDTTPMIFAGIDPGMEGALGFIHPTDNKQTIAIDIPSTMFETSKKTKSGKGKRKRSVYDYGRINQYFDVIEPHAGKIQLCLEQGQTRATDNGITGLAVGIGYGMWPLFLLRMGISCHEVVPTVWKGKMNLWKKDKEFSRLYAQRLFPSAPLFNKCHHNRAEALLLAEYLRRLHVSDS